MRTSDPCMQWLMVPAPRRGLSGSSSTPVTSACHIGRNAGSVMYDQTTSRGAAWTRSRM